MVWRAGLGSPEERRALLAKALQYEPDEAACQACLSSLDEYVAAQLAGEAYMERFRDTAVHLDACLDCASASARLYELEVAAATGNLPQPEHVPAPNLNFLSSPPIARPSVAAQAQRTVITLAERLRAALRRTGNQLTLQFSAELVPLLRPQLALAPVRAPADTERYSEVLLTLEPDETLRPDLPITLTVYRDAQQPEECLIEVQVEPPGRSWPDLGNIKVAVVVAGERREATTDAWGLASFAGIPVAHLAAMAIEVTL